MRTMGVDYGDARVGIALSDPLGLTAQAHDVLETRRDGDVVDRIAALAVEWDVGEIVVGWPLNMNGSVGPRAQATESFAARLRERVSIPVALFDERLSTVGAERFLLEGDVPRKKRKRVVDKVAAALILQSFLQARRKT